MDVDPFGRPVSAIPGRARASMGTYASSALAQQATAIRVFQRSPAAPIRQIGQREHVETGEQHQGERGEWRVNHPGRGLANSYGDEIGDHGQRKGDRQPAMGLTNPRVPVQRDLL